MMRIIVILNYTVTRFDDYSLSADSILINDLSSPDLKLSLIPNEISESGSAAQSSPVTHAPLLDYCTNTFYDHTITIAIRPQ